MEGASKKTIAVWFSSGAASAVAAKKTIEKYGKDYNIRIVNNPILEEHEDNVRFLKDVEAWLGIEIEFATHPNYPTGSAEQVWKDRKYMGGISGAPCTMLLKREARHLWELRHKPDFHVLGFTSEEVKRHESFSERQGGALIPVLIDEGITKADCYRILHEAGLKLPEIYRLGYPNANCIGCVKATSPTYWNHVRVQHPEVFEKRAEMSREFGVRLTRVKGVRLFLDELDPKAKGERLKSLDFECGIFCDPDED